jgi:uncharacterized membrane protein YeaQ/YmgE (transglycosylase-associated protein family)
VFVTNQNSATVAGFTVLTDGSISTISLTPTNTGPSGMALNPLQNSLIVSLVLHYPLKYRVVESFEGFLAKVIVGWFGAWLGPPVLGHWPVNLRFGDVYPIPAFLGSLVAVFSCVFVFKRLSALGLLVPKVATAETTGGRRKEVA